MCGQVINFFSLLSIFWKIKEAYEITLSCAPLIFYAYDFTLLSVCVYPKPFSFCMPAISYQRKVGH
jgi:hypothetical protein